MAITIEDFLKQYNLVDTQLSSYDNDTIQTITKVINGKIDDYANPKNDNVLIYIGLYYEYIKNDADLAEKCYFLVVNKNGPNAMNNLGALYEKQGKLDSSEKYYLMAIENGNSNAMNNLGILYEKQGKLDSSEKYYLMAIENGNSNSMHNLATLYEKQGKLYLAAKYFLMAADQNNSNTMHSLGILYRNKNKLDLAEEYFTMAINNNNHPFSMNSLGLLYKQQHKMDLAEKYYLMAIEHNSKMALYNLGRLYEEQHKFNLATRYYLQAVLVDADTIKDIVRIIPSLSQEQQLNILESVPRMRTTNEYFHKIPEAVRTIFANKQMEMMRCLSYYLIQDIANICVAYY